MRRNSKELDNRVTLFGQWFGELVTWSQSRRQTVSCERFHEMKDSQHGARRKVQFPA